MSSKKTKHKANLNIVLLIIVLIGGIYTYNKRSVNSKPIKAATEKQIPFSKVKPTEVLNKDKNNEKIDSFSNWQMLKGPVSQSPKCINNSKPIETIQMPPQEIFNFYRNFISYNKLIFVDPFMYCIKLNQIITIGDVIPRGKIKIEALELVQINKKTLGTLHPGKMTSLLDVFQWARLTLDYLQTYDFSPFNSDFRIGLLISYKIIEPKKIDLQWAGSNKTPLISGISYFSKSNFSKINSIQNKIIFDLRNESDFQKGHIIGALSAPYILNRKSLPLSFSGNNPNVANIQNDSWNYRFLPKDKSTTIIFYGEDQYDPRPWAFYLLLNQFGFKNLGWILNGYVEHIGAPPSVLDKSKYPIPSNHILEPEDLLLLIKKNNVRLVYVGTRELPKNLFKSIAKIPYFENEFRFPQGPQPFEELLLKKDKFDFSRLPNNNSEKIVLIDFDDLSNKPIKAALWLKNSDYLNVYIYPYGLSNIHGLSLAQPENFKCMLTGLFNDCLR